MSCWQRATAILRRLHDENRAVGVIGRYGLSGVDFAPTDILRAIVNKAATWTKLLFVIVM